MTTHLDRSATILGFPASKLKAALKSWERSGKPFDDIADLAQVSTRPGVAAALMGEAVLRNLVSFVDDDWKESNDGGLGLTREGVALVAATQRGRTKKAKASPVVEAVLSRAQALMEDELAPRKVDKIWLFGSYIDPEKDDVGDIDIVVESYRTDVVPFANIYHHVLENYPGMVSEDADFDQRLRAEDVFVKKSVFGPRKHALLSPNSVDILIDLHRPCALFFDRARGGVITPEFFEHHPESTGRGDNIRDRLSLPDLDRRSPTFLLTPPMVVDPRFSPHTMEKGFKHIEHETLDAGDAADIFLLNHGNALSVEVARRADLGDGTWEYTAHVSVDTVAEGASEYAWYHLAGRLVALAHADLVRLADHRHGLGCMQDIIIEIQLADIPADHPLRRAVSKHIEGAFSNLRGRAGIAPCHAFGIDFLCDGDGTFLYSPSEYDEEDWDLAGHLPFSREDYFSWLDSNPESVRQYVEHPEVSDCEKTIFTI